jgi:CubicO group peptidase (beta-lactamase class C family)
MLIEEYIERTCSMVPSLNCLVFNRDGEDIYSKSYGLANIERKIKATIETSYGIGSITKIFTALSIFKLNENKPNILDSYIYEYFNNTKLFDTLKNSNIKIKHLLSHTTGISSLAFSESRYNPNYFLIGKDINKNNIYDILQNININKVDSPGKNFRYLNIGYILLGIIIEKISKIEYESYVEKNIFKTLGMNSTCFSNASLPSKNIATPYIVASSKINTIGSLLNSEFQQAGGIVSNLTDLKKLIISLLSKDSKNKIIKDITFKKMCSTQKILKYNTSINKTYSGLGFFINKNFCGDNLIFHNGGIMGGRANVSIIPKKGVGAIVLTNSDDISAEEVSKVLISNLVYKKTFQNKLEFSEITKNILGEYTSYNNNINATIRKKGNKLELIFDYMPKQKTYLLLPKQYSQTRLVMSAINLSEYSTKNIFKYDLKKGYFEINQYIFFKTKNI